MPGSRRGQHDNQRDGNTTWCLHSTIPLLGSAAGLQSFLPGDQINALNRRRLLVLGHTSVRHASSLENNSDRPLRGDTNEWTA